MRLQGNKDTGGARHRATKTFKCDAALPPNKITSRHSPGAMTLR